MGAARIELATFCLRGSCCYQLSYAPMGPEEGHDPSHNGHLPSTGFIRPRASPEDSGNTWCQRPDSNRCSLPLMRRALIHMSFPGEYGGGGRI